MTKFLKNKGIAYYLGVGAALLSLAVAIVGSIVKGMQWESWNINITILLLIGVACEIGLFFFPDEGLTVIPLVFYSIAFALILPDALPVIADCLRQVVWVGGNYPACFIYVIFIALALILSTVRCFLYRKK